MRITTEFKCAAGIVAGLGLLAGCGRHSDSRLILTKEVFFAAAKKCDARNPQFTVDLQGNLPTIGFEGPSPATGECITRALNNYQFGSMEISAAAKQ